MFTMTEIPHTVDMRETAENIILILLLYSLFNINHNVTKTPHTANMSEPAHDHNLNFITNSNMAW